MTLTTLSERSPAFAPDPNYRNIMASINDDNAVNVDHARATGEKMLCSTQLPVTCLGGVSKLLP